MNKLIEGVKQQARKKASERGAREETLRIVSVEVVPLAYIANGAVRIAVKAVGELGTEGVELEENCESNVEGSEEGGDVYEGSVEYASGQDADYGTEEVVDYETYKPSVLGNEWILSQTDLCTFRF